MDLPKALNRVIEYCFYGLFFFTPLIFNPLRNFPSYELFEWNKMMFVYVITVLIIGSWTIKIFLEKKFTYRRSPFDLPLLLFLASQTLSTIFSIDRHVSFFGYYSRFHGGLLSLISYTLLYFAAVQNREVFNLSKLLKFAFVSISLVAGYGILEKWGIDKNMWVQDVVARVFSTLGQPNWLAALLALGLPIVLSDLVKEKLSFFDSKTTTLTIGSIIFIFLGNEIFDLSNINELVKLSHSTIIFLAVAALGLILRLTRRFDRITLLGFVLFYICLLFTRSRSGFLGFWIAYAFFWVTLILRVSFRTYKPVFIYISSILVICNFLFTTPFAQYNSLLTVKLFRSSPPEVVNEVQTSTVLENGGITDSADIRKIVWTGAFEIIKNYPLWGTGPETFAFAYYQFRPVSHNLTSEWDFLYNRAHNEILNIAATSGIVGLAAYLIFSLTVILLGLKWIIANEKLHLLLLGMVTALIAIHVTNFFGFSVVVVGIYFFLIPAMMVALRPETEKEKSRTFTLPSWVEIIGVPIAIIVMLAGFYYLAGSWLTDSYYARGYTLRRQENLQEARENLVIATSARPFEPVYHDERAVIAGQLALNLIAQGEATKGAQLIDEALNESSYALQISKKNVNFWKNRTRILYQLAFIDPEFSQAALESLRIAQTLAPTDPKIAYNIAIILNEMKKTDEAIKQLEFTLQLKPNYKDAYLALYTLYKKNDQIDKARVTIVEALKAINPNDEELKLRLYELDTGSTEEANLNQQI